MDSEDNAIKRFINAIQKPMYTPIKIVLDILFAIISVFLGCIWFNFDLLHYVVPCMGQPESECHHPNSGFIILLSVPITTALCLFWFVLRYLDPIMQKYQKVSQRIIDILTIGGAIFGAFVVYKIYGIIGAILFLIPIAISLFSRIKK